MAAFVRLRNGLAALAAFGLVPAAHAEGVGEGAHARSELLRVGVPRVGEPGHLAAAADVGGGVTEALNGADSGHGRVAASGAVAVDATRFLNLGLWLGGRYDRHGRDAEGVDDGFLFQSELSARLAFRAGALGYGFEASAWLPGGKDVGQSLAAVGADGKLLVSAQTSPSLLVAGFLGYRLDRSAKAVDDPSRLRFGDHSALGASDYDALLLGLGGAYAAGRTTLFGEAAAQLLLGSPKLGASPIWLTLGARRPVGPTGLSAELNASGLLSARPEVGPTSPLFPIEPRVVLTLGLRYRFGAAEETTKSAAPAPAAVPVAPAVAPPVVAPPPSIDLVLLDERGQPLPRARVLVSQDGTETALVETEPGHYRLEGAKPGKALLHAEADGFKPFEREVELGAGKALRLDARAEPALPAGQVRGLVRSFRGKPLAAKVRLEPSGAEAKTDAEGFFQVDVPPGEYEVVIESPGFEPQRRKAKVDQQGVVIVNADLVQKK